MKKLLIVVIAIVVLLGGYLFIKNNDNYLSETNNSYKTETKEYINLEYRLKFNYPASWTLEEKSISDFFGSAIGADFYTGQAVILDNPDIPKKAYDCCYTPEEIEKTGIKPKLVLMVIESVKDSVQLNKKYFGSKTMNIFNELVSKGYSPNYIERLLSFVPNIGEFPDPNKVGPENAVWKDSCNEVNLLTINGNYVVKYSGCSEGVVENTGALFVRKDNLILQLKDDASEYSSIGDFDKILDSFEFN